jgi:tripartite-type tricarboxylate transporter receptor subunit TctC
VVTNNNKQNNGRRIGRRGIIGMAFLSAAATLVAACSSSAASSAGGSAGDSAGGSGSSATSVSAGSAASGLSFFKGKTITLISPDAAGGSFDLWSRLLAPAIGSYLHATVNVEDVAGGNTIVGQNQAANASPNGLTLGWINANQNLEFQITGQGSISFTPTDEDLLGAPAQNTVVWVTSPNANLKTWQSVVDLKKFSSLDVTSGTADLYERTLYCAYGLQPKMVTGYENAKAIEAGFLRGDGPIAEEELSVFADAITSGSAVPVLYSELPPSSSVTPYLQKAQSIAQLAQSDQPSTSSGKAILAEVQRLAVLPNNILFAPKGTPADEVSALSAAVHSALSNSSVQAQAVKEGLTPAATTGAQALSALKAAVAGASTLKSCLS